ncbi:MAG: TauD/TfdA dioxygenase family protein [Acidimicrobiia bacterium]
MHADGVTFEQVTGTVGARVHGVDVRVEQPAATADALRNALHRFGVLFFESDGILEREHFDRFGTVFGTKERYLIAASDDPNALIDSDLTPMEEFRINHWHTDGTALECPPDTAMLTPVELPPVGGDTMWASMYAAWEGLSSHYQRLLDGLEALHSTFRLPFLEIRSAVHPVVLRDPVTQRRLLFVNSNWTEGIVGMSPRESDSLLEMLYQHVNTPEYHVRLRWRPGTVAVWHERVTQHRGVADFVGPRKLRRAIFPGDRPRA